jgi:hypothetical protein
MPPSRRCLRLRTASPGRWTRVDPPWGGTERPWPRRRPLS